MVEDIYLMESDEEAIRLDVKTDPEVVCRQAMWAGAASGMRVADLGCGSGKTTKILHELVQPGGSVVGLDFSEARVDFAKKTHGKTGAHFHVRDIRDSMADLGQFDLVWVRFVLEYYRTESQDIVRNIVSLLKPGGILCLIDLDYNCLSHYGLPTRLERGMHGIMARLEQHANFYPYVGRKLYAFVYDIGFTHIDVQITPHHLIYGDLENSVEFNFIKKVEIAGKKSGYPFPEYPNGYTGFFEEFKASFKSPRRFTYTPVICCKGRKPK
ncbi:Methyltransferase type 12 [Olavius algarvensis associated proteobacterium Delta 3]|nr:Methyltransferase type 12 [Olavius algarvensis associated proteobacterium Delta 3]